MATSATTPPPPPPRTTPASPSTQHAPRHLPRLHTNSSFINSSLTNTEPTSIIMVGCVLFISLRAHRVGISGLSHRSAPALPIPPGFPPGPSQVCDYRHSLPTGTTDCLFGKCGPV